MHGKKRPYEIFLKNRSKNVRISYICFLIRSCLSRKKDKLKCFICLIVFIHVYGLLLWLRYYGGEVNNFICVVYKVERVINADT